MYSFTIYTFWFFCMFYLFLTALSTHTNAFWSHIRTILSYPLHPNSVSRLGPLRWGDPSQIGAAASYGLGSWTEKTGESETAPTSISLLPGAEHLVTCWLNFPRLWFPHRDGLHPQTVSQRNLPLPKVALAVWNTLRTPHTITAACSSSWKHSVRTVHSLY